MTSCRLPTTDCRTVTAAGWHVTIAGRYATTTIRKYSLLLESDLIDIGCKSGQLRYHKLGLFEP